MRSATEMSGVASFSEYRRSRGEPVDREVVALLGVLRSAIEADRGEGVVVDLAAAHDWGLLVEERHQASDDAGLGLAALAQEDDVLPGQHGVFHLGDDRVLKAHDAGEERGALSHAGHEVLGGSPHGRGARDVRTCVARRGWLPSGRQPWDPPGVNGRLKVVQSCTRSGACQPKERWLARRVRGGRWGCRSDG